MRPLCYPLARQIHHYRAPMITFNCTIQEGIIPEELRPRLASELARICASVLSGDPDDVSVNWIEVPYGFGFRGGRLSTTSAVRGEIPPGCQQETRVRLEPILITPNIQFFIAKMQVISCY